MKKLGFVMMLIVFLLAFPKSGEASSSNAAIFLDGEPLNLSSGVQVANMKGNVMIPIRVVSENLGFKVGWEKASQTVTVENSEKTVRMVVGSHQAELNGAQVDLNLPPVLNGKSTLVPLRFVSEQMGLDVKWDNQSKAVFLSSSLPPVSEGEVDPDAGNNPGSQTPPPVETGNQAAMTGLSFSDNRLMIATEGAVTPNVFKVTGPDRIVIDLPDTVFSSAFLAGHAVNAQSGGEMEITDYPDVMKVRYATFSDKPSTVRVVIDLTGPTNYGVTQEAGLIIVDLNAEGEILVPPVPPVTGNGKKTVVIDAGHGGSQPGAISANGNQEKVLNLNIALKVEALLRKEKNINVVMTRSDDSTLGLSDRVKVANSIKADIFVSIHGNSNNSSSPHGTETYFTRDASKPLANVMHKHLVKATELMDRGVKYSSLHVTRETTMPAVLLEIGFLSNKGDEAQLFEDDFQNRVAQGIVAGIKEYLQVQ
ncbi:N-acetylmuramoyl-L-alanine amidase family protein [Paenibacillus lautus]|uniref:N-acetylmuramoyl-L-alanine amidase family protein n=1 Tax=Paenibacillus lautus TaxID=1401 RepID=UPI001C127739|nr:N-acetylmuramoyl-L-alanine amidase family protein [Paenibacillus lautus]MBU5345558.1 N-acetylmuramoyl-L-alanine amidase family protein [Paenibacillus lautus]